MRHHFTPISMAKIRNTDSTKCWWGCGATGTLVHWRECKLVQPLWKTVWQFLTKLSTVLPYNPAIMLLGIYSKELKTQVHIRTCTGMFIAALFLTAKIWKQPRCPSVGEWINLHIQWCTGWIGRAYWHTQYVNCIHTYTRVSSVAASSPLWWGTLMLGEVVRVWGQGVYRTFLYLPLNFALTLNCSKKGLKILMGPNSKQLLQNSWVLIIIIIKMHNI